MDGKGAEVSRTAHMRTQSIRFARQARAIDLIFQRALGAIIRCTFPTGFVVCYFLHGQSQRRMRARVLALSELVVLGVHDIRVYEQMRTQPKELKC